MQVANLSDDRLSVQSVVNMTAEQYAAFKAHPTKAPLFWPVETDAEPTFTSAQKVLPGDPLYVIEAARVRQTWRVVEKSQAELNADTSAAEKPQLAAMLAALTSSIETPDVTGTAAERLAKIEARMLRLERIARHYVRGLQ